MLDEINGNWNVGELKYPFGNGINFQIEIEDIEGFVQKDRKNIGAERNTMQYTGLKNI